MRAGLNNLRKTKEIVRESYEYQEFGICHLRTNVPKFGVLRICKIIFITLGSTTSTVVNNSRITKKIVK